MKKLLFFSMIVLCLVHCKEDDVIDPIAIDCTAVACTEEFITLIVTVKDSDGVLIPLDRFEVIDLKTAENVTPNISFDNFQIARRNGEYPLYNDSFVSGNQNTKRNIVFRGYINEEKIAEAEYVIDTDCCHVSIAIGDADIAIN